MKTIKEVILESSKDQWGNEILGREDVSLDILKKALYAGSFMKDRATIYVDDNGCWNKIDKDKWQYSSNQEHVISGTVSSKELWDKYVEPAKEIKMYTK